MWRTFGQTCAECSMPRAPVPTLTSRTSSLVPAFPATTSGAAMAAEQQKGSRARRPGYDGRVEDRLLKKNNRNGSNIRDKMNPI